MTNSDVVDRQSFPAGDYIFMAGDKADCAYIVQEGSVSIVKNAGGETTVLSSIPKGGIFGEMALIDNEPRMASARMEKGGTLIVVNRAAFEMRLSKADPFIRTLLRIFVDTIRRLERVETK
jgi:CRP/FNR family cyclic AMP-dependent transcriptional regulator